MRISMSITAGIAVVVLLLIVGTGATSILRTTHAQSETLGEPFFVEKGSDTIQTKTGHNTTHYTFTSNGTMKGNIEAKQGSMSVSPKTI